ncbi:MAG: SLBB domain-containing protein [Acidobacteria bacterium]|nr:SLBB domain-containing protein [Acidobacteriota bacterium]
MTARLPRLHPFLLLALMLVVAAAPARAGQGGYLIGPQDVLVITMYDQPDLSGRFAVEADGTFTFPYVGRMHAAGLTGPAFEAALKERLREDGFFMNPQIVISVGTYGSQRVVVLGEVRRPGVYAVSAGIPVVEALARAGSTLPTASGEVVVARGDREVLRLFIQDLEHAQAIPDLMLRGGDTIFVLRAEQMFVFGQVKNPGAYPRPRDATVLQALSLAGGLTGRGSTSRITIVRNVDGGHRSFRASPDGSVGPGDTIIVGERFF